MVETQANPPKLVTRRRKAKEPHQATLTTAVLKTDSNSKKSRKRVQGSGAEPRTQKVCKGIRLKSKNKGLKGRPAKSREIKPEQDTTHLAPLTKKSSTEEVKQGTRGRRKAKQSAKEREEVGFQDERHKLHKLQDLPPAMPAADSLYEGSDDDSGDSYSVDPNTKLFVIERVVKQMPKRGKKRAKRAVAAKAEKPQLRKSHVGVSSIGGAASSNSSSKCPTPATEKLDSREEIPWWKSSRNLKDEEWRERKMGDVKVVEDGPTPEVDKMSEIKLWLDRGSSAQQNETNAQLRQSLPLQPWRSPNVKCSPSLISKASLEYENGEQLQNADDELETSFFDWFIEFDIRKFRLERKVAQIWSKAPEPIFEEVPVLGDQQFPLFNQY